MIIRLALLPVWILASPARAGLSLFLTGSGSSSGVVFANESSSAQVQWSRDFLNIDSDTFVVVNTDSTGAVSSGNSVQASGSLSGTVAIPWPSGNPSLGVYILSALDAQNNPLASLPFTVEGSLISSVSVTSSPPSSTSSISDPPSPLLVSTSNPSSTTSPDPNAASPAPAAGSSDQASSESTSAPTSASTASSKTPVIVGAVVGVLIFFFLLAVIIIFFLRRRLRRSNNSSVPILASGSSSPFKRGADDIQFQKQRMVQPHTSHPSISFEPLRLDEEDQYHQYQYHDAAAQYDSDTKEDMISTESYDEALPAYGYSNFDVVEKADYQQRQNTIQQSGDDRLIQEIPRSASVSYQPRAQLPPGAMRIVPR